jgi:hypothetical protein
MGHMQLDYQKLACDRFGMQSTSGDLHLAADNCCFQQIWEETDYLLLVVLACEKNNANNTVSMQ